MVSENPDFTMGRFYLAKALLDSGDLPAAEAEATEALKQDPDHYYAPLGHYVLADIYAATGRAPLAQKEVEFGRRLESRKLPPPPS
jgi:Tfp pilus assembly protein PilF